MKQLIDLIRKKRPGADYIHLNPEYFPEATRTLFPTSFLLKNGVLPLGQKTHWSFFRKIKKLNVGLLDPRSKESLKEVEVLAREKLGKEFGGLKIDLILADEYLSVLEKSYHLTVSDIRKINRSELAKTLRSHLE